MVSAVDMAKKYGDFIALHPLNVEVHAGEFFGVFGPNGAGKSTFIKLLTGQLRPSKGRIEVLGVDAVNDPQKVKANIGIVHESESPPSFLTPAEFLEFVARLRGVEDMKTKVEHWLEWFGMQEKRDTMCKDLERSTAESHARQRLHSQAKAAVPRRTFRQSRPDLPAKVQGMAARPRC